MNNRLVHVYWSRISGRIRAPRLTHRILDFRETLQYLVLLAQDIPSFINRDRGISHRHVHQIAFIQWWHELLADSRSEKDRAKKQQGGKSHREQPVIQGEAQNGTIDKVQSAHHGICLLGMKLP